MQKKNGNVSWSNRAPHRPGLVALGCVAFLLTILSDSRPASAFGRDGWRNIHERITRDSFGFMKGSILDVIVDGNLDEDQGAAEDDPRRHAQNCRFRDSANYVNMRYQEVVEALREPPAGDSTRAARYFGHILHGLQDFYAHSNWIPTPPQGLGIRNRIFNSGVGFWPVPVPYSNPFLDVAIVEGDPPSGVTIRLPSNGEGKVSSAVPIVEDRRVITPPSTVRRYSGLMTSAAPREPGDQWCPPVDEDCEIDSPENVCLRHGSKRSSGTSSRTFDGAGRLNLDGGGGGDWQEARRQARKQTEHEWCRLLHLSRDLDPTFLASGRLLAYWAASDSGPNARHIPGTPCQRSYTRRHRVEVEAFAALIPPGDVPFVLFRSDFTDSARVTTRFTDIKTLTLCGNPGDRIVASIVPPKGKGATYAFAVPEAAKSWLELVNENGYLVNFTVTVTPDGC